MVPSGMLKICSAAIARPGWEPILKYLLIFGIVIGIIAASLMAYFEAGTIVSGAVVATVRVVSPDSEGKYILAFVLFGLCWPMSFELDLCWPMR